MITNFITNAAKFTPKGGIIMGWEVNDDTNKVELYVEDTGIGLSEEDRKMVFSRFFKKDEFKQGTGLGLSICKLIVSRLGGSIKVKSQLGKGSRFSVFLSIQQN
ncbi:MAG: HAMP domain-containing histidine kinase [Prevotella sp.]|nr:HAMP domain-containing histidine kinase [Prevotella sp.]